ncbi:MAG: four helix bundle protein [Patescibacteria group bacterium]|nr:four helix bundle protein [Patescibacteria group bacterium]
MSNKNREPNILIEKADSFVHRVYTVTRTFPREEIYGIISQLRRAALSIILNAIEGFARNSKNEHRHFLDMSYGSLKEAKYLLYFSYKEGFLKENDYKELLKSCDELGRIIWSKKETLQQ